MASDDVNIWLTIWFVMLRVTFRLSGEKGNWGLQAAAAKAPSSNFVHGTRAAAANGPPGTAGHGPGVERGQAGRDRAFCIL
jgi:hypothetical protein